MGLIQKAGSYGSRYKGHHLNTGGKFRGHKISDGRLKEHHLRDGRKLHEEGLNADHY